MKLTFDQIKLIADTADERIKALKSNIKYAEDYLNAEINNQLEAIEDWTEEDAKRIHDDVYANNWRADDLHENERDLVRWQELLKTIRNTVY